MIKTLKQLKKLFNQSNTTERGFNALCIDMVTKGEMTKEIFLEYLECTQTDVYDWFKKEVK